AIALVAVALLWLLRRASAEARYWSSLLALGLMVATPVITWGYLPARLSPRVSDWRLAFEIEIPQTDSPPVREMQARQTLAIDPELATARFKNEQLQIEQLQNERAREATRHAASAPRATWWPNVERTVTPWLPAIVLAWCGGMLLFALRPLASWL